MSSYYDIREDFRKFIVEYFTGKDVDDDSYANEVKDIVFQRSNQMNLSFEEKKRLINDIVDMTRGLGILQPILNDKTVTEIMVNGTDNILVEQEGKITELNVKFDDSKELERIIRKVVEDVDRQINKSSPIVDARLQDGSRINAVFPPVALNGPILTIRKFPENPLTVEQLIKWGSITPEVAEVLETMVKAGFNIFVSGGTGSGKTTFLNMLSNFIPKDERIITVEDSAELQIKSVKNLVRLETRHSGEGESTNITIRELIRSSLRMRPDRVVVGEVRGEEALDMLQAMNTGHDGSLSTGHANSTIDMMSRLETMVLMAVQLPLPAIRQQIASALDVVVHLGRLRDKTRKVLEVTEVVGYSDGEIKLNPLYEFVETGVSEEKKVLGQLESVGNKMVNTKKFSMAGFDIPV